MSSWILQEMIKMKLMALSFINQAARSGLRKLNSWQEGIAIGTE
jgi:hypothetical protein